ncbi:MAG: hypothetical protein HUU50_07910 [Candidatus Brocadiae bacterium]|nr:hypothetical protein [Candidatus Brocadiia bacterium]
MSKIRSAIRKGKEIVVLLDYMPDKEGEKANLYLVGKDKQNASKALRNPGKKLQFVFPFFSEEEANVYTKAYLQAPGTNPTSSVLILDREPSGTLFPFMLKAMALPFLAVLSIWFLGRAFLYNEPEIAVRNIKAYFSTNSSILVQGEIVFSERLLDKAQEKLMSSLKIRLYQENKQESEMPVKDTIFYAKFPCSLVNSKANYAIEILHKNSVLHRESVAYNPSFPIVLIQNTRWEQGFLVVAAESLNPIEQSLDFLLVSKATDKDPWIARELYVPKGNLKIGPIGQYSPVYTLMVRTPYHIVAQKEIACTIPLGQISRVEALELNSISVEGMWDGPESSSISLEVWDKLTQSTIQKVIVEKKFSKKFLLSPFQSEYIIELKHEMETLASAPVVSSEALKEYFLALAQMPAFLNAWDESLQIINQDSFSRIERLEKNCQHYKEILSSLAKKWQEEKERKNAQSLQEFYSNLQVLCEWIQEEKDLTNNNEGFLDRFVEKKHWALVGLLDSFLKILHQFHPRLKENVFFSVINKAMQKREQKIQYNSWMESIYTFSKEDKTSLAIHTCDSALKEFPEEWIFLLARYNLYQREYNRFYMDSYEQKAKEDYARLLSTGKKIWEEFYKNNQKGKAYAFGSQLLALEKEKSLENKIESLRSTTTLAEKIDALLEIQKFQFPFIVQKISFSQNQKDRKK